MRSERGGVRGEKGVGLSAEGTSLFIKGNAHKAILEFFDVTRQNDAVGRTIIDVLAIRRKGGEGLEFQTVSK